MIVGRVTAPPFRPCAQPYPVTARRRAVAVLVSPLHVDEPAPAALVGVALFFPLRPHFVRPAALSRRRVFFSFGHVVSAAAQRGSWSSDGARNCSALAATGVVRNS